ncbi:MAG: glycosyltransferase [Methanoregulaceae archaeon]|nr:glycosyltransferase [Methanoregulaceae archaeon]
MTTVAPVPVATKRLEVLIQNPMLPPYRLDLFRALNRSPVIDPSFSFGLAHPSTSLVDVTGDHGLQLLPVENVFVRGHTLTVQRGLLDHVRSRKWDAMVASFDPRMVLNLMAMRAAKKQGTKFVWWGHGIRPRQKYQSIYRRLAMGADAVILYSGEGKRRLEDLGVPSEKLFVAWNSIDTDTIAQLRRNDIERYRILTIGRLVAGKKIELLLEAFKAALPMLPPSIKLTIVGEGPEEGRLRSLADQLSISGRVEWLGAIYDEVALAPLFNSALFTATGGDAGLSIIHSLAYGVPTLVGRGEHHGPEVEVLTPENSATFESGDRDGIGKLFADLCENKERLAVMGEAGAKKVLEQFSVSRMVKTFEEAVTFACGGGKHR